MSSPCSISRLLTALGSSFEAPSPCGPSRPLSHWPSSSLSDHLNSGSLATLPFSRKNRTISSHSPYIKRRFTFLLGRFSLGKAAFPSSTSLHLSNCRSPTCQSSHNGNASCHHGHSVSRGTCAHYHDRRDDLHEVVAGGFGSC
jgi:hypothetical protein